MQDFNSSQAQLNKARAARAAAESSVAQAAELQRKLTQQLALLSRSLNPGDRISLKQKVDLEAQVKRLENTLEKMSPGEFDFPKAKEVAALLPITPILLAGDPVKK